MERIKGETFAEIDRPERRERRRKAVELILRGASAEFALEHTRLESFIAQIEDDHQFMDLLSPLPEMIGETLPVPGRYVLVVQPRAVKGARQANKIREALAGWVRDTASVLEVGSPGTSPRHYRRERPPGVPFEVSLYRWPGRGGRLRIARSVPEELEGKRLQRVRAALDAKLPKLRSEKEGGRVTILVLESDDLPLANLDLIAQALQKAIREYGDNAPDEIYLVETEQEPWIAWVIKYGPAFYPDVPSCDSCSMEIASQVAPTGRRSAERMISVEAIAEAVAPWAAQLEEKCRVFAFGSQVKGTARDDSDIDLAIEFPELHPSEAVGYYMEHKEKWNALLSHQFGRVVHVDVLAAGWTARIERYLGEASILIFSNAD
jgi:predicted nucleotidyltransferase